MTMHTPFKYSTLVCYGIPSRSLAFHWTVFTWFELRVNAVDMLACPCVYVTRSSETKPQEPWALAAEGGQRGHLPCPWNLKKLTSYAIGARRGNLGSNLLVDAVVAKWYCDYVTRNTRTWCSVFTGSDICTRLTHPHKVSTCLPTFWHSLARVRWTRLFAGVN